MRKEWIRTEEERHSRKLKRLYKQQKKLDKLCNISFIERKKDRRTLSNQLIPYKQPVTSQFKINKNIFVCFFCFRYFQ